MKNIINAAQGKIKANLIIKNCNYADVFTKKFKKGNIAIYNGVILGDGEYTAEKEIDANGAYLCPSFTDSHVHIESSMITPNEYAKAVVPRGITSVIADPHEITNVCGVAGIDFMMECSKDVPLDISFMLPSCVPATPFENSGAIIDGDKTIKLLKEKNFKGLGEMMNYPGILSTDDDVLKKISTGGIIDGHAPLLSGMPLNAYISAGIKTDHECTTGNEMLEKISKGMYVLIREGTCSKNLEDLIPYINDDIVSRCMFCTDDRYLGDILNQGTIDYCVKKAVENGVSPINAIIMASYNPCICYNLKSKGAIAPGYKADLILIDDFENVNILKVFKNGELVAENGIPLFETHNNIDTSKVTNTVNRIEITAQNLKSEYDGEEINAIQIIPKSLITKKVKAIGGKGTSKVCVIERHNKLNNIGKGYVLNYNIQNGAIASTIGHDSHNIIVIGDNEEDMALAVNTLGQNGGISVCQNGDVLSYMPLEIGGLMSVANSQTVLKMHTELHTVAQKLNINPLIDPFMLLAFLPLPVIPELKITDKGLFDVINFKFIEK